MEPLTRDTLRTLIQPHEAPCVSLYQPTHRHHPDNQQDPIRFRNLVREVEASLSQKFVGRELRPLLAPFRALADDTEFWNHTLDGLAVLATAKTFRVFRLQRPVRELAVVAESFHVRPLVRVVQSADRYQVLCLTRRTARMFEGNRFALDELDPGDFPTTITAALGEERTDPRDMVDSYVTGKGAASPMHHGLASQADKVDKDTEKYFRAVDRAATTQFSQPSGLPLLLAALPEHQPVFRAVSQNPALVAGAVDGNPDALALDELRTLAWQAVEPRYLARLAALSEEFANAAAHQKGTSDLSDAARAAVNGQVATLLVEAERVIPGRFDARTGAISRSALDHPEVDDLLDDLAEAVLRSGGEVVVVPADRMPTAAGLAATYRY